MTCPLASESDLRNVQLQQVVLCHIQCSSWRSLSFSSVQHSGLVHHATAALLPQHILLPCKASCFKPFFLFLNSEKHSHFCGTWALPSGMGRVGIFLERMHLKACNWCCFPSPIRWTQNIAHANKFDEISSLSGNFKLPLEIQLAAPSPSYLRYFIHDQHEQIEAEPPAPAWEQCWYRFCLISRLAETTYY